MIAVQHSRWAAIIVPFGVQANHLLKHELS